MCSVLWTEVWQEGIMFTESWCLLSALYMFFHEYSQQPCEPGPITLAILQVRTHGGSA